jgi:hypothetical protein
MVGKKTVISKSAHDRQEPIIVGYWADSLDDPTLPFPHANPVAWKRQNQFVAKLEAIEEDVRNRRYGKRIAYKGYSWCRLCGAMPNGSEKFEFGGFAWPSGLLHYIKSHNVRPPDDFVAAILKV